MSEQEQAGCPVEVTTGSFHWHRCGKPIKRNGKCGLHASADERRERNDAARLAAARERRRQADLLAAEAAVQRVRALLDGALMVPQADVRRALETTAAPNQAASDGGKS